MSSDNAERELHEADRLLRKADALLQRHRNGTELPAEDDDDLPLVTDVVIDGTAGHAPEERVHEIELAERLVDLDTAIARAVEAWIAEELPLIVEREVGRLTERLQIETIAHLRATLMPRLSEEIATRLADSRSPLRPQPR